MHDMISRAIVIGLGNPILSDDGVGWRVVQHLQAELETQPNSPPVHIVEACVGGLSLAELLVGFRRAVIVDAIMTGNVAPGTVLTLGLSDLPGTLNSASAHDTNLTTALRALRRFGADLPPDEAIGIVAIEAQDVWTFSETCTPPVEQSIPVAVAAVWSLLQRQD
jgi:hydrogenase maturation protease